MSERDLSPQDPSRIVADLERKRALLHTINEFALNLLAIPSESELVWYVAREVVGRLGFVDCVIYRVVPEKKLLRQVAAIGAKNPHDHEILNALEIPIGKGITGHVAQTKKPAIVADVDQDSRYIPDVEASRSEICVPLVIDDEVVGVIDCEDPRPGYFDRDHLELLTTIAAMTSAKLKLVKESRRVEERTEALGRLNEQLKIEVAERRQTEEALRTREALFKQALEVSKLGYWSSDPQTHTLHISPEMADLMGVPVEEVDGIANDAYCKRFVHPDDRKLYRELTNTPTDRPWRYDLEYRLLGGDGSISWIYEVGESLLDEEGRIVGEAGTIQDITETRRAEQAVRTRDAWLRAILENAPIQIVLKDTESRIMAISRNVAADVGIEVEEFIGRTTADFLPEEIASVYLAADRDVLKTGQPIQQEVVEERDGSARHMLNAKFPLTDDRYQIVGVCSITTDITESKRAEAQLFRAQKLEAVGQLTGGVAHDFNNLLAVVQGNAEILAEIVGEDDKAVRGILRASARGAELTQRLLAFSRQQPLWPQAIALQDLVAGMSELLKSALGETIAVETMADPDLWAAAADPGQVENALLNLAINARDAMVDGGKLTIECLNARLDETYLAQSPEAVAGDYVVLAVSDSGRGMTAEEIERAFEPFFTTKEVGEGSGLGLSMVYGFAKQSDGHVSLYSEPGKGTTVKVYLPRAAHAPERPEKDGTEAVPRGQGETILVIEDNEEVRGLAVRMIERLGYRVRDVPEAASALSLLEQEGDSIDLVLSDVVLPGGMSGPKFADAAREFRPDLKVIFMSGYPAEASHRNGLLAPDKVLLNKPFEKRQLARALREALDR
jgi:PAS domain S-box-containing protein